MGRFHWLHVSCGVLSSAATAVASQALRLASQVWPEDLLAAAGLRQALPWRPPTGCTRTWKPRCGACLRLHFGPRFSWQPVLALQLGRLNK
jgi:hypothetical protein